MGPVAALADAPRAALAEQVVTTQRFGQSALDGYVHESGVVDSVVIVQRGAIVYERYPRMRPHDTHIWWSIAKSLVATLVALLEERGLVDVAAPVEAYLPEVAGSGWQGVSVRDVLDMASGIACSESEGAYGDPDICVSRYEASLGLLPPNARTPADTWAFVAALPRAAPPGEVFDYASVNTFLLGVLAERVSGLSFAELATRDVWSRIGAEADASVVISRHGDAVTHGGLCSTLRDLARYGLLFTPSWPVVSSEQIVSRRHLDAIQHGGRPDLFARGKSGASRVAALGGERPRHNTYQWDLVMPDGDFYKGGYAARASTSPPPVTS
jgi:CubicO group peptidase (beta-lactamase class C family)